MELVPSKDQLTKTYQAIKGIKLPSIPDIVQQANAELSKPDPNIRNLSELISKDPVLSGQILKIVNSPYYGLSKKIDSVQKAVVLLGQKNLKNVLMTAGLRKAMDKDDDALKTFWDRAAATAACASGLAAMVHGIQPDEAYMTGLFLDTGALVLLEKSDAYKKVLEIQPIYPYSIIKFENQKYETNHTTVGYLLALNWKVPDNVAMAILHSHTSDYDIFEDPKVRALVAIMQLSYSLIGEELAHEPIDSEEHIKFKTQALDELLIDEDDIEQIVREAMSEAVDG